MSLIANIRHYPSHQPSGKRAMVLCGFWGSIWQVRRLIRTLNRAGYDVTALDVSSSVLRAGDAALLPALTTEVATLAEATAATSNEPPVLVGVSLGALLVLNIVRRSKRFNSGVLITGGDIVKIARKLFRRTWRLPYEEHAALWRDINMYSDPRRLEGKRLLFVLPKKDRLVDKNDLRCEIAAQQAYGNTLLIVERRAFGHFGTIFEETVLLPRRTLSYITRLKDATIRS